MEIFVVGGGIAGLSTAWSLIRRGHRVTVLEQADEIPNPLGASGDQHRIIRRGYGAADGYAALISEAFDAWEALWADLGTSHYVETGVLSVCQKSGDEADVIREGYDRMGISYQRLAPAEAAARYRFLDPEALVYATLAPEGGALLCQRIAADLVDWLTARGATLRAGVRVAAVDTAQASVTLSDGTELRADRLVVAAGGWTTQLLPDLAPMLETRRTHVAYATPPADLHDAWGRAPVILSIGGDNEGWAIPPVADTGLKFGCALMQYRADPDARRPGGEAKGREILNLFAPPIARIAEYGIASVRECVYTFTNDECFFGEVRGRTTIVSACSGHGYKYGAAVGRRVAEATETGDGAGLLRWLRAEARLDAA